MTRIERLLGSPSVLGYNDSRGVILSEDRTTPEESYNPRMERHQGSNSVQGWNDSRGLVCPGKDQLQGIHSVLG